MDIPSSLLQHQDDDAGTTFLFDCQSLLEQNYTVSDAGYHSGCGSLSPASSVDSGLFSPPFLHHFDARPESFPECSSFKMPDDFAEKKKKESQPTKRTGRPRSKFPGLKRESASEREKLRMRDLTKALNNLRTYLPPSVAPVGQNLTKIETLRLTIHYIASLSAQLGLKDAENLSGSEQAPDTTSTTFQTESFYPDASQSFSSQEFFYTQEPFQNAHNPALPLSPPQEYWCPQQQQQPQQYSYYGQF